MSSQARKHEGKENETSNNQPIELEDRNITETKAIPKNILSIQQLLDSDYKLLKKFRDEMNNYPSDVPDELKGLTEIEEMLIAQICLIVSVYYLYEGQYGYRENVINFS
ncbi:29587_t:CDS:2 [Gigaspora margarita]|uniref:29587_t:CDS:1 n=1 Tax=Gigaspora margarita TaxID=4874 RepID=A0ABN7W433_GIGMA|nr:29587_t:CDS:2 [Gigaspora margarita]